MFHSSSSKLTPDNGLTSTHYVESMNSSVPLLVFTPRVGHKEHISTHMKFHTGTVQFRMLNGPWRIFSAFNQISAL